MIRSYISNRLPYRSRMVAAPEPLDRVGEVEVHAQAAGADAAALVAHRLGRARRDVARREVAEAGIPALEVVVALGLGDLVAAAAVSPARLGTHTRPSFRSDSLISVSFDWYSPLTGMQVGWIWV